jgi:transposase
MTVAMAAQVAKHLGGLPAAGEFLRRLDVAGIVDGLCPIRDVADLTHGQVVEVLIANRLTAPAPLVRVADWGEKWAVEEVFGVDHRLLNDDRLARTLDAIAPHLEQLVGTVGAAAICEFGIDVSRCHWDMTSMSLFGDYRDQFGEYPQVKYGHPKDRRTDLKQVQAGIAVTGDGGIPVLSKVYSGGAGEVAQVADAMRALQKIAGKQKFLLVGDSKLVSYPNIGELIAAKVQFIAPAPAASIKDGFWAGRDVAAARPVDYVAARDAGKDPADRGAYRVAEDTFVLAGPRKADPVHQLRRVLVHSTGNADGQAAARAKRLARAAADLDKVAAGAGGRYYNTEQKIAERVGVIAKTRRVKSCLVTAIGTDQTTGKPTFTWHFDPDVLAAEAKADGWYALLTNIGADAADAEQILRKYKGQPAVERRYGEFKGPLAVTPLFLKTNRRIAALLTVICLALLVFCLIERQVRQALGDEQTMIGLYPDNRRVRPTGRMIFYQLSSLMLTPGNINSPPQIMIYRPVQARLLELLGIEETTPRWPDT